MTSDMAAAVPLHVVLDRQEGAISNTMINVGYEEGDIDLSLSFERTVRVADNDKVCRQHLFWISTSECILADPKQTNDLPPSLGSFPLYPVSQFKGLPSYMQAKGGVFFPMLVAMNQCRM